MYNYYVQYYTATATPQTAIFGTEWMLEFIQNTEFWATRVVFRKFTRL